MLRVMKLSDTTDWYKCYSRTYLITDAIFLIVDTRLCVLTEALLKGMQLNSIMNGWASRFATRCGWFS